MSLAEPSPMGCVRAPAVRAYDIRGKAPSQIDTDDAYALGIAYAAQARARGLRRIGVGRDGRITSPQFEAALVRGLADGGMAVHRIGLGPTPMLAFAVRRLGLDGGVMVTASHNPSDENGFKLLLGSDRIHGEALAQLAATRGDPAPGGSVETAEVLDAYVARLAQAAGRMAPLRVAWDCGNGAAGPAVERLVRDLPGRHHLLHTRVDGRFPNHHPDPAVEANLCDLRQAVLAHGCDVGLAFDGDGDRIGVVDEEGQVLWADQLLLFLSREVVAANPGATIVADVKSSTVLFEGVRAAGGRSVMAASGYVLVREAMRREGALLGGELSGHIFYADRWDGTDDGLYVAARLLCALSASLAENGGSLAAFRRALPTKVATPELRISCPEPRKSRVVAAVAARLRRRGARMDPALGLRVESADGWWLLRASGTEPKLTLRCEGRDEAALVRVKGALREELAAVGMEVDLG